MMLQILSKFSLRFKYQNYTVESDIEVLSQGRQEESTESYSQSLKLQDLEQAPGLGGYIYFGKLTAPFLLMLLEATGCSEPFVAKVTSNSES